ncbi:hypothetical protein [Streptomyces sp. CB02959]|uniref:hypothetical protein n=1 Tax=Streptomyces sp. CB02959 TaxID=2020330 RepID=UPI0011AEFABF|nr:hypothetical protein [Streptomyces sp. CB02959]
MENPLPRKAIQGLLVLLALAVIAGLISLQVILYGAKKDSWKLLIPGMLASLVAVLIVYVVSKTILRSTQAFLSNEAIEDLSGRIVSSVERAAVARQGAYALMYKWYEIPWRDLLAGASQVDVVASYMDTWVNHVSNSLRAAFDHGCVVRMYLPLIGSDAARRVSERFPEYDSEGIKSKIRNTPAKMQTLRGDPSSRKGKLEVWSTRTFCMWCLVLIDRRWLIVDPFDHFRRGAIEGPGFVIDLEQNPEWLAWADKELSGFKNTGTKESF